MEISESDASSAMTFGSDAQMPEEPVEEPIYFGRKREKFYKIISERGEGIDKPGTIDEVVVRYCEFLENLSDKPFVTVNLGKGLLPEYIEKGIVSMKKGEISDLHIPETLTEGEPLIIKIELLSFINKHDLHGNGMMIKKVLNKSSNIDRINDKDEIKINLLIKQDDLIVYQADNLEIIVGVSDLPEGLFEILRSMKYKEVSETVIDYNYFIQKFKYPIKFETNPIALIEIVEFIKVTDIYVNGGFYKKILEPGTNESPHSNSQVEFEYSVEWPENAIKGSFVAFLDESVIPSLWEDALKLMKLEEYSKIQCFKHDGSYHLRDGLEEKFNCPYETPIIHLKLLKILKGGPLYEMEDSEKLEIALRMKKAGTDLFRKNLFERAIEKYDNGLGALNPAKDNLDLFKDIFITLQLNVALSFFKLKEYRKCILRCDRILDIDPEDFKALFRKAMAFKMMCEFVNANENLDKGRKFAENKQRAEFVKEFDKEIKAVNELVQAYRKKEKKLYANLFKDSD
jgi:hypothetical protein